MPLYPLIHRTTLGALVAFPLVAVGVAGGQEVATPGDDALGEWTTPAKNYAATRYSGLTEITAANASQLHPTWTPMLVGPDAMSPPLWFTNG